MYVLVVDDDPLICKMVKFILTEEGHEVYTVTGANAAFPMIEDRKPDLFILDVMMPGVDGFELCKRLRSSNSDSMILFLTAKGELNDRVSGLQLGADDYLVKPFEPAELAARIKALMRRYRRANEGPFTTQIKAGSVELHVSDLKVVVASDTGGRTVGVTPTEMKLLRSLMANTGHIVSRDVLLDSIWGDGGSDSDGQVIDVYIRRLRKKLENDPSNPKFIESVRGVGYKFNGSVGK